MTLSTKTTVRLLSAKDLSLKKPVSSQLYKLTFFTSKLTVNGKGKLNVPSKKDDLFLLIENTKGFSSDLQCALSFLEDANLSSVFHNQMIGWNLIP